MSGQSSNFHAGKVIAVGVGRGTRFLCCVLVMLLTLQSTLMAEGSGNSERIRFDIPRQRADIALTEFAEQAGLTLIFPFEEVREKTANELVGEYSREEAVEILLDGTGLEPKFSTRIVLRIAAVAQTELEGDKMNNEDKASIGRKIATALASIFLASGASAQEGDSQMQGEALEEIVVTGSRIARDGFTTPTPVTVVDQRTIEMSGFANIDDILIRVPAIGIGVGSSTTRRNEDAGAALINLRGLGTNRSLTVINGRRRVSGSARSSAVDLNTIPASMIERVEVITGGASAIYGADAVSGVVNVITKTGFEGLEFSVRGGISEQGDAESYSASLFGGAKFAEDRGALNFGLSYVGQGALEAIDRSYSRTWLSTAPNPANTGPNDGIADNITITDLRSNFEINDATFFLHPTTYIWTANGLDTVRHGDLCITGCPASPLTVFDGGDQHSVRVVEEFLRFPTDTFAARSDISYELSGGVSFFTEVEFAKRESTSREGWYRFDERPTFFSGHGAPRIQLDNPFLPAEVAALMTTNGLTELQVRKEMRQELGPLENHHDRTTYTGILGLEGAFANDWNWQVFYQYGESEDNIQSTNLLIHDRFINAADVIADPVTGQPVCRDEAARAAGCVPYNIFVTAPFSQELRNYAVHTRLQDVRNTQEIFGAQLTGAVLVDRSAGPVSFAMGAEQRTESLETWDDGLSLAGQVRFFGLHNPRQPVDEEITVTEGFAEVLVPILDGLDVEAAVRASDYDTIGSTTAWKVGLNWALNDATRFRYTRSRSVRAPNLMELFGPSNVAVGNALSPCDATRIEANPNRLANCRELGVPEGFQDPRNPTDFISSGNVNLQEETSNSFTIGAVLTPQWTGDLSFSVDYYNIEIDGAVSSFSRTDIPDRCFDAASLDNVFCDLITFGPDLMAVRVDIIPINVSKLKTSGVDFAASYKFHEASWGALGLQVIGTYLLEKEQLVVPHDPSTLVIEDGEIADPTLRFTAALNYTRGDAWRVSLINRFISESDVDRQASPEQFDIPTIDWEVYTDVVADYRISDRTSVFGGINNLLDTEPPYSAPTFRGTDGASLYDNIGRFAHFGFRTRF